MLFHASIPAADPARTAAAIAELWDGEITPFPPVPGGFMVFAGDERGTLLEIYPADTALAPGPREAVRTPADPTQPLGVHLAVGVPHDVPRVLEIAGRMGWTARRCNRGGAFDVVEVWIDDRLLIEVLTPEMQRDYVAAVGPGNRRHVAGLAALG